MSITVQDFSVRITFPNGVFTVCAQASTAQRAYELALVDARMGNPFEVYDGPVQSWEALPAEPRPAENEPWSRRRYP
jgi:hypothetical protein